MTAPAVISASLVDVRNIAAHKCVRLEIHVPVEQAGLVMAAFGWPTSVDPVPVAIARLDLSKPAVEPEKVRKPFDTLPAPQQAALRCNDVNFQRFIGANDADGAALMVRRYCEIESRSELATSDKAAKLWRVLDDQYFRESRGIR
jgi:hypothetical protein